MEHRPCQYFRVVPRLTAALFICLLTSAATAQKLSPGIARENRERGLAMLSEIKEIIKAEYYDPQFHGLDLDKHFSAASARIKELDTNSQRLCGP
jgi:hypothetical protein